MTITGIREIRNMIDKVGEGDLAGAETAFETAVMARREAQIKDYKTILAQNSFQPPESHPGQDTGITGAPDEVDEDKAYDKAVDDATMAHAKGDVEGSKKIMRKGAAAEKQRRANIKNWGKEAQNSEYVPQGTEI